jgi:hypothetical protein
VTETREWRIAGFKLIRHELVPHPPGGRGRWSAAVFPPNGRGDSWTWAVLWPGHHDPHKREEGTASSVYEAAARADAFARSIGIAPRGDLDAATAGAFLAEVDRQHAHIAEQKGLAAARRRTDEGPRQALTRDDASTVAERYADENDLTRVPADAGRERPTSWFFPVSYIGSRGIVIDKSTARVTALGSAFDLDDWLWAYDAGLLNEHTVLRVTSVRDLDRTIEFILYNVNCGPAGRDPNPRRAWIRHHLSALPAEFPEQELALRSPAFRKAQESGWFTFEVTGGAPG